MKRITTIFAAILMTASVFLPQQASAQAPQKMSYQAVVRNSSDALITSSSVGMRIQILQGSEFGAALYVETQTPTTNTNGLVSLEIGAGIIVSGDFSTIDWANGPYFIRTETDPNGGANYTITGTSELLSVPYALFSANGTPGPQGIQGPQGPAGLTGATGSVGSTGDTGPQGPIGLTGPQGIQGVAGATGPIGLTGPAGAQGLTGAAGANGAQGIQGITGATGLPGTNGTNGTNGINGSDGNGITQTTDNGDGTFTFTYDDGSTFTTSDLTGSQGATGTQGLQGIQGAQGPAGANGANGTNGSDGNGIASTVDNGDGTFTFTYDDGSTFTTSDLTGPQGIQGIQGVAGANGTNGTNGLDGNGIASTVDNGDGTFTLTYDDGTTFITSDLTGPQGATGAQGAQGTQGIQGIQGVAGANGTNGTNGLDGNGIASTVDNGDGTFTLTYDNGTTFTTSDLTGPQGATGAQGAQGIQGIQGIQGVAGANGTNGTNGLDGNGIASTVDNGDGTFTLTYDDGTTFTTSDLTGPAGSQDAWGLIGNAGTDPTTNFIGTTDTQDFVIKTNNLETVRVLSSGEVGIGATPDASAKLDVSSTSQGFLPPRLTIAERDAIASPAVGLVIYNTTTNCLNFYVGSGWNETCGTASLPLGVVSTINCGSATITGTLTSGTAASGVSVSVPYTGGNAGTYGAQSVSSTGVVGLTATLAAGTLANGAGSVSYSITGTPSTSGTASFAITVGGQSCTFTVSVGVNLLAQYPAGSVFCAAGPTAIVDVTNPATGKIWMDRNLGAIQVATSSIDANSYGDLYQWGRRADGHQCRNSATTSTNSSSDQPGHGNFILEPNLPYDWRSPQNTNLWQGVNGVNNPCPSGYRLPTETELNAERLSWSVNTSVGAFASPLRLPMAGSRRNSNGSLGNVGTGGNYWSSTVSSAYSRHLNFDSGNAGMYTDGRALGYSVRCLKD